MKKGLLFLLLLVTMQASAQMTVTEEFDFTKPLQLSPSVALPDNYHGASSPVFDKTFKEGNVDLFFGRDGTNGGSWIEARSADNDKFIYSLVLYHCYLMIKVPTGCTISSIEFIGYNNLTPAESVTSSGNKWFPSGSYSQMKFQHLVNQSPYIDKIIVEYQAPTATISPNAVSLIDKDSKSYSYPSITTVPTFHALELNFGGDLSLLNASGVSMVQTDNANAAIPVTVSAAGGIATIKANSDITEDGSFSVSVASRTFQRGSYQNTALSYTFKVEKNRATFEMIESDPQNNSSLDKLSFPIVLTFPQKEDNYIGTVDEESVFDLQRQTEGEDEYQTIAYVKAIKGEAGKVTINTTGDMKNYTTKGAYRIVLPAGLVKNQLYTNPKADLYCYSPEITLSYTVTTPPDPLQEKKDKVAELKEEANRLFGMIGKTIGYPKADDTTSPLASVKGMDIPDTEELLDAAIANLNTAISAFYKITDVVLPKQATGTTDGWYYLAGVNSSGIKMYFKFENDGAAVSLTTNKNSAAVFQAVKVDDTNNTIVLKSKDGKYLHLPHSGDNYDIGGMTLTDEELSINTMKLEKFILDSKERELAGMFTLYGSLGTKFDGTVAEKSAYALYKYDSMSANSDPEQAKEALVYDEIMSNAFTFENATEPESEVNVLTPEVLKAIIKLENAGDPFSITILSNGNGLKTVNLSENPQPYFMKDGEKVAYAGTILSKADVEGNFNVNTAGLASGIYVLKMPKGTFVFEPNEAGKTVKDIELSKDFVIVNGSAPVTPTPEFSNGKLTIKNVTSANLNSGVSPYYTLNGETVSFTGTILTSNGDGSFMVNTTGLAKGTYLLVLPANLFTLVVNGQAKPSSVMEVAITVSDSVTPPPTPGGDTDSHNFVTDFTDYSTYPAISGDDAIMDTDLNDFWVYRYKDASSKLNFFVDSNKKVVLGGYSNGQVYREGHFELDPNFIRTDVWAYKIVWDTPIKKGDIYKNEWVGVGIKIPTGTLGDANFGAWLADHSSVPESACHVNLYQANSIYFRVDNDAAADNENKEAFTNYKTEQKAVVDGKAQEGDSEECAALITAAKAAIDALSYDTTKSLDANKELVDVIIAKLDEDLAAQRAKDAVNTAFADYKAEKKTVATNRAQEGDSEECAALITAAKAAIDALSYDTTKSLDANKELVDAIIAKLDEDLATQRDIDASKAALSKAIADATAYVESIKGEHKAFADVLDLAITAAKAKLSDVTATKSDLDDAKQTLESAVATIKQAIATGIEEMEVSGGVEGAAYYTLDGRKLDGKPTKKGVYIVNGRKVVIK